MTLTHSQFAALLGHRAHALRMIRDLQWLSLDPARRPALVREMISIQSRLSQ